MSSRRALASYGATNARAGRGASSRTGGQAKWQRLKPYEKFAEMIDRHWDGIAAYCRLENKVSLGFVEGLNNKIRVIQRRAYGLRNEDYLRLKILTCMLPEL
jgi:transposase